MPVMDEFKDEREKIKNGTFKEKLSYFIYYYKWHVLGILLAILCVVTFIVQLVNQTEDALYVCMLNTTEKGESIYDVSQEASAEYGSLFAAYAGIDTDEYDIYFDTSMQIDVNSFDETTVNSTQKYITYLAAAEMDVILSDPEAFLYYAYQEDFYDLREILNDEQIEKYQDYFFYVDGADIAAYQEYLDSGESLYTDYELDAPDPTKPEEMEDPIPIGLYLNSRETLNQYFFFQDESVVAGVFVNTERLDAALQYLDFVMQDEIE